MRERGTVPNEVTCSALMDACLKANEVDLAFAVLEHMLDLGIEPTQVLVVLVMVFVVLVVLAVVGVGVCSGGASVVVGGVGGVGVGGVGGGDGGVAAVVVIVVDDDVLVNW